MKQITFYLFIFVLLFSGTNSAQPVLTAASNNPVVGDVLTQYQTIYMPAGLSGANVSWNFTPLTSTATITNTYSTPAGTLYGSTFPSSNIASYVNVSSNPYYMYYANNASALTVVGMYVASTNSALVYSNGEKLLQYPMYYTTAYTDSFALTVSGYNRRGVVNVVADGWGTLIMLYGSLSNVMRVKATETYSDYMGGNLVSSYSSINYYWYRPGTHAPIVQFSEMYTNGTLSQQYGIYLDAANVGIKENDAAQNSFKCYPIPAKDNVTIEIPQQKTNSETTIIICDINGKELIKQIIPQLVNKTDINISALTNGVYFVKIINAEIVETGKIIKQ